jgi:quercetin dioxygenase-like cupin family protein
MITRRPEMKVEQRDKMRGGAGTTTLVHLADGSAMRNARLLAEITLPPGASIGEHSHDSETEYYIVLSGKGVVVDDGRPKDIGPGDVVSTGGGASHSIAAAPDSALTFIAVIITY